LSPFAFHTLWTMDCVLPSSSASERVLQWVAFAGFSRVVVSMILLSTLRRLVGFLPPRGRSFSMPVKPCAANRFRHLPTVASVTFSSLAICLFCSPAAARSTICARCARRTAVLRPRAHCCSCFWSSSLNVMVGAMRMVVSPLNTKAVIHAG